MSFPSVQNRGLTCGLMIILFGNMVNYLLGNIVYHPMSVRSLWLKYSQCVHNNYFYYDCFHHICNGFWSKIYLWYLIGMFIVLGYCWYLDSLLYHLLRSIKLSESPENVGSDLISFEVIYLCIIAWCLTKYVDPCLLLWFVKIFWILEYMVRRKLSRIVPFSGVYKPLRFPWTWLI